ncbi:hypothetical protein SDC9_186589 [bioreactor metagenome]|uniref:Uncharacterized protein n=1 Tax=bioreactor metagenome TaxID=1076179 RepID=A0A645HUL2_9ZZZZ
MVGAAGELPGDVGGVVIVAFMQCLPVHQRGAAGGEGAGLVERDDLELAGFFQRAAALDENAALGGCGQRADDGDGRGDD